MQPHLHQFLEFTPIEQPIPEQATWVFFGSKNAVNFTRKEALIGKELACVGEKTAKHLLKVHGLKAKFIGEGNDVSSIVDKLAKGLSNNDRVIYPCSDRSLKTAEKTLTKLGYHCTSLPIYRTILNAKHFSDVFDVLMFTSPSQVDGFLLENNILKDQLLIAIGSTTAKHLQSMGYETHIPRQSTKEAMIELLGKSISV